MHLKMGPRRLLTSEEVEEILKRFPPPPASGDEEDPLEVMFYVRFCSGLRKIELTNEAALSKPILDLHIFKLICEVAEEMKISLKDMIRKYHPETDEVLLRLDKVFG